MVYLREYGMESGNKAEISGGHSDCSKINIMARIRESFTGEKEDMNIKICSFRYAYFFCIGPFL